MYDANVNRTSSYALGELVYNGGDLANFASYSKRGPEFCSANGLWGTGGESLPVLVQQGSPGMSPMLTKR